MPTSYDKKFRVWLIQRLKSPFKIPEGMENVPLMQFAAANPFAFGGGLANGGFSKEAMKALTGVFEFDYMGSAEFEWGAVPKAFRMLAEGRKALVAYEIEGLPRPVYVLAPKALQSEVTGYLRVLGSERYPEGVRLKETSQFYDALTPGAKDSYPVKTVAWLELDNPFFFTIDKTIFETMKAMFQVKEKK